MVYVRSNELARLCSCARIARNMSRPTAIPSAAARELLSVAGSSIWRNAGSGWAPMTLSTAIFSGSGVSNPSGLDSRSRPKMPAIFSQCGRACCNTRR